MHTHTVCWKSFNWKAFIWMSKELSACVVCVCLLFFLFLLPSTVFCRCLALANLPTGSAKKSHSNNRLFMKISYQQLYQPGNNSSFIRISYPSSFFLYKIDVCSSLAHNSILNWYLRASRDSRTESWSWNRFASHKLGLPLCAWATRNLKYKTVLPNFDELKKRRYLRMFIIGTFLKIHSYNTAQELILLEFEISLDNIFKWGHCPQQHHINRWNI